jgi:hypothetical protein
MFIDNETAPPAHLGSPAATSQLPSPERTKPSAMPTDNSRRLGDYQGIHNARLLPHRRSKQDRYRYSIVSGDLRHPSRVGSALFLVEECTNGRYRGGRLFSASALNLERQRKSHLWPPLVGTAFANRISYVISPEGKILYAYSDSSPSRPCFYELQFSPCIVAEYRRFS